MIKNIKANPVIPTYWGKAQSGMQASQELRGLRLWLIKRLWRLGGRLNLFGSRLLASLGLHKQLANRNTEYFSYIKTIVTTTDVDNFFTLRIHPDAQPELCELASKMNMEMHVSVPELLAAGEWHTPYVTHYRDEKGVLKYETNYCNLDANTAKKVSVSCCAQVSYRKNDNSAEKAVKIFDKLISSEVFHASPFEHVATPAPIMLPHTENKFSIGITGYDNKRHPISGNFVGWLQYRHTIDKIQMKK